MFGASAIWGAALGADDPSIIQRVPVLVQTSVHADVPPRASTNACDNVGASAPNTAISTASHTARGRRSRAKCSFSDIG